MGHVALVPPGEVEPEQALSIRNLSYSSALSRGTPPCQILTRGMVSPPAVGLGRLKPDVRDQATLTAVTLRPLR